MSEPKQHDSKQPSGMQAAIGAAGPLFGAGIQMAVGIVLMFYVGKWLDVKWGTAPWLMLAGIMFGSVAGMVQFIRAANKASRETEDESRAAHKEL